ncbi:MAG: class I SAM-dependent methyltransferase [Bacteroidia bacterium]|nr:class I SAM-dependent methyltransferase [Bacteroidia bacterium]
MSTSVFDSSAHNYDVEFTQTPIGSMQRNRVYKFLRPLLSLQTKLLEINCGTGQDAINMAPFVSSIMATDISQPMIEIAEKKRMHAKLNNVSFKCIDINVLHLGLNNKFDLLLSNFGGLNCLSEKELRAFSNNIEPFISEQGQLALVIMGKKCWIENLWYLLRKDARYKRRNTKKGLHTKINDSTFYTYYYSPEEIGLIFSSHFQIKKVRPIGLFIPPSYLNPFFTNKAWLLKTLYFFEKLFGRLAFLSNYSDHYLIILTKKQLPL